ncbi:MAG: hypothetical protein KGL38_09900 [Gemmatimonadota bacterium]|nr:hypothetical protein [Gemmatimonadota bacterium]MDE3128306.1 hypothetical protein [Gemmatimonadota bacterium]MDE3173557.1 hypothetical protein [Gemmatimonadota bacterium]MDE3214884.1 hypothetical protein [Gemmatimonadota bacterium]
MTSSTPEDLFRAEKERSQSERGSTHAQLLAEAKAAFDKLMAEGQAARKSGRPRKNPPPPLRAAVPAPATPGAAARPAKKAAAPKKPAKKAARPAAKKPPVRAAKKAANRKPAKKARSHGPAKHGKRR